MYNVQFFNKRLLSFVDYLQEHHNRPFLLVLQGDHGCSNYDTVMGDLKDDIYFQKAHILNAYYFYDQNYAQLHPEITPVNTYRIIFNQYFNTDLELLEDNTYYSTDTVFNLKKLYPKE